MRNDHFVAQNEIVAVAILNIYKSNNFVVLTEWQTQLKFGGKVQLNSKMSHVTRIAFENQDGDGQEWQLFRVLTFWRRN